MKELFFKRIISAALLIYGLVNLAVFVLSSFLVVYIAIVGILCLIAGCGMLLSLSWSIRLAIPLGFVLSVMGIVTLYASIISAGFAPSQSVALVNLGLTAYAAASVVLVVSLITKQRTFLSET